MTEAHAWHGQPLSVVGKCEGVTVEKAGPRPTGNRVLDALPGSEFERLSGHLERVPLVLWDTLVFPEDRIAHAFFPLQGVVSMLCPLADGSATEVAVIGSEAVVGFSALFGTTASPYEFAVQAEGTALRVPVSLLKEEFDRSGRLRELVLQCAELRLEQLAQTAACNVRHGLEQRAACWFLGMRDRIGADRFPLTHQFLAMLLGVRRASVTLAASDLQQKASFDIDAAKSRFSTRQVSRRRPASATER